MTVRFERVDLSFNDKLCMDLEERLPDGTIRIMLDYHPDGTYSMCYNPDNDSYYDILKALYEFYNDTDCMPLPKFGEGGKVVTIDCYSK